MVPQKVAKIAGPCGYLVVSAHPGIG